ncbi:sugar-binding protein [Pedobacter yonginense]|uniref:Sugar-binding protein n=1 Tax=Pedobacter yonginense TaxID=651869 RepID=A0A317EQX9_9SPHI|nr:sugar-binding protein [Pedobacter yonginense]
MITIIRTKRSIMNRYTKFLSISLALAVQLGTARAQNLVLNTYSGQRTITAGKSVTLKDGFYVPEGNTLRIFTGTSYVNCFPLSAAPSANQNYIMSRVFKTAGVNSGNIDNARSACEEMRTIAYFDGLGRPIQTISVQASPTGKDIIQPMAYDALGRERFKYLPYTEAGNNGAYRADALSIGQPAFYTSTGDAVKTPKPFSETVFEASPLNRVLQQGAPGIIWQPSVGVDTGHVVRTDYGTNATGEVRLWTVGTNGASSLNAFYQPGKLYKTVSKDENWKTADGKAGTTEEFKDFEGRVVLKRTWETGTKSLSTYYVYDDLGNLDYVLPPAVNENGIAGYANLASFIETDEAFLRYIYGYHYDGRKRLIEKKIPGKGWEYMVYNKLDQVVLTQDANQQTKGQWLFTKYDALGRTVYSGIYNSPDTRNNLQTSVNGQGVLWESRDNGTTIGYTNSAFPQTATSNQTISYYDDYAFPGNTLGGAAAGQMDGARIKGLPTGTKITTLGTGTMLLTTFYYDEEGRTVQTRAENHLGGRDITDNTYNFAGELTASLRTHTQTLNGAETKIANRYEYDHAGRKLATMESINGQDEVTLSKLDYNELGQLKGKNLHGTDGTTFMQNTGFAYNERGWMKGSTSKEFSMELRYANGTLPQYNGNIVDQKWGLGAVLPNTYTYTYDGLNRLKKGISTGIVMSEELTYDVMGNINTLNRDNTGANQYSYTGNRLNSVAGVTAQNYQYDANGNATLDGRNGMALTYNYLNLPATANKAGVLVAYTYDASGKKLTKNSNGAIRQYVDGIEYNGNTIDIIHTEEGVAQNNSGNYSYHYNLTDHLGNVRYTFDIYNGAVRRLQADDYYAFGKRRSVSPVGLDNKYLYNGKEVQDELGEHYDYGARFYDPIIGRWNVPDMLAEMAPNLTPFRYCFNNPVNYTDPFGLWERTANGYSTDKKEDIERFLSMMQTESALNNKPNMSQISSFLDAEMKTEGSGILSNGGKLMEGFNISSQKDFYGGNNWVTDHKSYNKFWHRIQGDLTPEALDPRTLNQQWYGLLGDLSYPGGDNPKKYNGKYDYSYQPTNIVEYPGIWHDLNYDKAGINGIKGLATSPKVINADWTFVGQELFLAAHPMLSVKQRAQALILGAGLGIIALPKTQVFLPLKIIYKNK